MFCRSKVFQIVVRTRMVVNLSTVVSQEMHLALSKGQSLEHVDFYW